jgi:hypothetical protein
VTWFPDRKISERGAIALCEEHHLEMRLRISQGALELPDRFIEPQDLPVAEPASASDVYSALGRADPGLKHRLSGDIPVRGPNGEIVGYR